MTQPNRTGLVNKKMERIFLHINLDNFSLWIHNQWDKKLYKNRRVWWRLKNINNLDGYKIGISLIEIDMDIKKRNLFSGKKKKVIFFRGLRSRLKIDKIHIQKSVTKGQ